LPPKVKSSRWSDLSVRLLIRNRRYIGDWSYGRTEVIWRNKAGYAEQVEREKPLMDHIDPALRIIDDETFALAQQKAANLQAQAGQRKKNPKGDSLPHLFEKLLWCPAHER